jgi:BASS family bile acid:Na+ symporter
MTTTNWVGVSTVAITGLAVICSCFNVGLVMGRAKVSLAKAELGLMARAVVLNFVLVPLLAIGLIWAFDLEGGLAASLVLLSALPAFPLIINIMHGRSIDTNGLELTFLMIGLSSISAPLIIWSSPVEGLDAGIGEMTFILVLFQLLPMFFGYLLGRTRPELFEPIEDIMTFLASISTALIVAYVILSSFNDIGELGGTHALLAVISLVIMGAFLGWVAGGPGRQGRRALALNTSLRNFMSCLLLVFAFFSGAGTELLVLLGGLFMLAIAVIVERTSAR